MIERLVIIVVTVIVTSIASSHAQLLPLLGNVGCSDVIFPQSSHPLVVP